MANLIRIPQLDDLAFIDDHVKVVNVIRITSARESNVWDRYCFTIGLKNGEWLDIALDRSFDWKRLYNKPSSSEIESRNKSMEKALRVITKLRSDIINLLPVQDIHSIILTLE